MTSVYLIFSLGCAPRYIKINMLKSENIFLLSSYHNSFLSSVFPTSGRGTIISSCHDCEILKFLGKFSFLSPKTLNGCQILYILSLLYLLNPYSFSRRSLKLPVLQTPFIPVYSTSLASDPDSLSSFLVFPYSDRNTEGSGSRVV